MPNRIDEMFSHDFSRFVLQNRADLPLPPKNIPSKPFSIAKAPKAEKDLKKKKKSPFDPTFKQDL